MIAIKTYQDLMAASTDEVTRNNFIISAIAEHKSSDKYRFAQRAQKYYEGENTAISDYFRIVYDMTGAAHRDMFGANHKIASNFFGMVVDQEVSYLLRNGIRFGENGTAEKMGADFSQRCADALTSAAIAGISFGFWNYDHLEVFDFVDSPSSPGFVPFYDEETGALMAGIRYWQIDASKPMRITLYEVDGITEFKKGKDGQLEVTKEKHNYKLITKTSVIDGTVVEPGGNYPTFPIVPLRYNRREVSELKGKKNTLDALDLVTSNLVNNVDEGNLIYWVLTNCDGMDDMDDIKFIEQLKITHVVHANGDAGASADAHTVEAPYAATENAIDTLTRRLYADFQAFDAAAVTAGDHTATAIRASYVPLDLKVDKVEDNVTDFILAILRLAGVDDRPSYERNQIANKMEETQRLLLGAEYYGEDYLTRKLLTMNGDADQVDEILRQRDAEEMSRFKQQEKELEQLKQNRNEEFKQGGTEE